MWKLKFKVKDKENPIRKLMRKNNLKINYYPLKHYEDAHKNYFVANAQIIGPEKNKERFLEELKKLNSKSRKTEFLQTSGDFVFVITSSLKNSSDYILKTVYNPALIHIRPVNWDKTGWERWEIISLNRKDLENLFGVLKKRYEISLEKFTRTKNIDFGIITAVPQLSQKQKEAIDIAVDEGYYNYPRKAHLKKLAEISGKSFSTFQENLCKAENKLIPFIRGNAKE